MVDGSKFFHLWRKRGSSLCLEILDGKKGKDVKEAEFFDALKKRKSYLNEFYRVKQKLLEYGLVGYKLDKDYDKVIFITDMGEEVLQKVSEITELMEEGKKASVERLKK